MKKQIALAPLVFALLIFATLSGCGGPDGAGSPPGGDRMPVTLSFRLPEESTARSKVVSAPSIVNSLELVVTGEGMDEIRTRFSVSPGEAFTETVDILLGPARIIAITVFDAEGRARLAGESAPFDVVLSETPLKVTIFLRALLQDVPSELPRFSSNYILIDIVGATPFVGKAESSNYTVTSRLPNLLKPANIDTPVEDSL